MPVWTSVSRLGRLVPRGLSRNRDPFLLVPREGLGGAVGPLT